MAFRKFSQPTPLKAARFEGMPNLINAINTNQILKARKDQAAAKAASEKRKRLDGMKYTNPGSQFPHDLVETEKKGISITNNLIKEELAGGQTQQTRDLMDNLSIEVREKQGDVIKRKQYLEMMDAKSKEDPDYISMVDRAKIEDFFSRSYDERKQIGTDSLELFDSTTFNQTGNLARYIKSIETDVSNKVKDSLGNISETKFTGAFLDNKGNISVSPTDANVYLNSKKEVSEFYNNAIDSLVGDEIRAMQESNLPEHKWMDGLGDNEIKTRILNNPSLNTINNRTFAQRKLQMAQKDLRSAVITDRKFNTTYAAENLDGGSDPDKVTIRKNAEYDSRYKTVYNAVAGRVDAALQAALGGVEGVKEIKFTYAKGAFPPKSSKDIIAINIPTIDPVGGKLVDGWEYIDIGDKEKEKAAMVRLSILIDDQIRSGGDAIGPDPILRRIEKDDRWNPDTKYKAKY